MTEVQEMAVPGGGGGRGAGDGGAGGRVAAGDGRGGEAQGMGWGRVKSFVTTNQSEEDLSAMMSAE